MQKYVQPNDARRESFDLPDTQQQLREAFERHVNALPVGNLEREQPFAWQYGLLSLFAYILMLTDVLRTGLAIHSLPYRQMEPNAYVYFGPLAYVTAHLTTSNATETDTIKFWTYKYDTTSMGMRTVVEHLKLHTWPPCVTYKQRCDETHGIPLKTVFSMVDSVVDGVSHHANHGVMTLRSHHEFKDRVYHYALPWFFNALKTRTTHVTHHEHTPPSQSWENRMLRSICAGTNSARRPTSCDTGWTNGRRLNCKSHVPSVTDSADCVASRSMPRIWDAMLVRQAQLARAYPNHSIDFVVLDAMEDFPRGSLTYQGRKDLEVVVLSRIRSCSSPVSCTTVAVDDYRYEAATFVMNALDWYTLVGILRFVGQTFAWLRLVWLVVGCCIARLREPRFHNATLGSRIAVTVRTVLLIPSQVVVYGSSFPITCYLLAHLIDSPAAYAMVQAYFTSLLGQMHWTMSDLFQHCAVSMRTVWVVGFICHRLVMLTTNSNWSPIHGVPGTAEFSITFIASLTIFAQFRSLAFRRATVLRVVEILPSKRRLQLYAERLDSTHSTINNLISGSPIDFQCLLCGFLGLFGITVFVWLLKKLFPTLMPMRLTLTSSTIAPYSAGTLWPRSRLVVSWYGTVVSFDDDPTKPKKKRALERIPTINIKPAVSNPSTPVASERRSTRYDSIKRAQQLYRGLMEMPDKAMVMRENTISKLLQRDMHSVDRRTREIESTVYLINLAAMTDPFTFLQLRLFDGHLVGLYKTKATERCFLLPYGLMTMEADIPIDWDALELIAVVNSKDLTWPDLLRCG